MGVTVTGTGIGAVIRQRIGCRVRSKHIDGQIERLVGHVLIVLAHRHVGGCRPIEEVFVKRLCRDGTHGAVTVGHDEDRDFPVARGGKGPHRPVHPLFGLGLQADREIPTLSLAHTVINIGMGRHGREYSRRQDNDKHYEQTSYHTKDSFAKRRIHGTMVLLL